MADIPICECAVFWEDHHVECPVRREIESLRATISRLRDALTAAAEQRKYLSSPYDTGWQDAIRWINQQVDDAAMAGGENGN